MKLYLVVNTYTGESKWLPFEEAEALNGQDYWEKDPTQAPLDCDKLEETIL